MKVESIAECCNTFDLHCAITVLKTDFGLLFEWPLKTDFTAFYTQSESVSDTSIVSKTSFHEFTIYLQVSSADNHRKHLGPYQAQRSGLIWIQTVCHYDSNPDRFF